LFVMAANIDALVTGLAGFHEVFSAELGVDEDEDDVCSGLSN